MKRHKSEPKAIEEFLDMGEELVQTFTSFDEHEDIVQALGDAADTARGMGYTALAVNSYTLAASAIQSFLDSNHLEVPLEAPGADGDVRKDSSANPAFMKLFVRVSKRIASESAKRAKNGKPCRHKPDDPEVPG